MSFRWQSIFVTSLSHENSCQCFDAFRVPFTATTLTTQLHQACSTNKEKNIKDAATRQQAGRNNLVNAGQKTNLITLLDFVRVAPTFSLTLSQDCHITRQVTVRSVLKVVV